MAYQINLTGQEIDERLQNIGTAEDNPDANGTLFARLNKNVDDIAENTTTLDDHEKRLSDVEDLVHRGLPVYGVEWNVNQTSSDVTRIGIPELHRTLPCHQLRGCLLADNGTVNRYLPQNDWTSATRDGSKGQVMVEIPEMWMKFEIDGDMRRVLLSPVAIGGFKHYQKRYVSAYEATVQRSTNKLASVVNTTEDYRGGDGETQYDGTEKTMLGKPRTALSQLAFQTSARNRFPNLAWNMYVYDVHCQLTWLFVVEYATLDSQKTYNAELTADGYHQGGLGSGATTMRSWSEWTTVNNNSSLLNCGATDSLGNNTGVVSASVDNLTINVIRYRGVENPFGHIDKICIGVASNNLFGVWASDNPSDFSNLYRDANYKGETPKKSTYISDIIFKKGVISPKLSTKSTQIFKDYFNNSEINTYFIFCVGGCADSQGGAGLFSHKTLLQTSTSRARGTRLCYLPQEDSSGTLRDLYIQAGAKYNEQTGYYELNGLTDITEEEMRVIYDRTWGWWIGLPNIAGFGSSYPRTNIPCPDYKAIVYKGSCSLSSCFNRGEETDNLEALNFRPKYLPNDSVFDQIKVSSMNWMCQGNKKPISVIGIINVHYVADNNSLNIGGNIKSINIKNLSKNIRFYGSEVLSKESVLYMINNSEGTDAFTISLNKAVYDVMKDDADIIAALAEKTNITLIQNT